jgi:hypothetical protein
MKDNQRQTSWAYVAGILDADGCFMIMKNNCKGPRRKNISYIPGIKVAMIEPEAIEFISKALGFGHFKLESARKDRPNSKPLYQWYLRNRKEGALFLIKVIPYLKVKKNRAIFLLEFMRNTENVVCAYGLSPEQLKYREESYWKMRELNGAKVAATTKFCGPERVSDSLNS